MSSSSPVILYRYDSSPFSVKVDHILLLKNIPHQIVNVSPILPRSEITDLLGINYRRIPILAIGNDVYCDTSLIASALERRFPSSDGYETIFPPRKNGGSADTGLIKAFAKHYADSVLFSPSSTLLQWDKIPQSFIADRNTFSGREIDVKELMASQPKAISFLSSHLGLVDEQLKDGREWLFDTELPSLADVSIHFLYAWIQPFRAARELFDSEKFPYALQWITRMTTFLQNKKISHPAISTKIPPIDAAKLIASASFEPYDVVSFDSTEATRLGLGAGSFIAIAPDDTGRNFPTTGKLVGLNREEFVIETQGSFGTIRCHFPRISFNARSAAGVGSKL